MDSNDHQVCSVPTCKKKDAAAQISDNPDDNSANSSIDPNLLSTQLKDRNEMLIKNIILLKRKRNELVDCYRKTTECNCDLENDLERLSYKIQLITKSLAQRLKARSLYDKTLREIENKYTELVKHSGKLLCAMENEITNLVETIEKQKSPEKTIYKHANEAAKMKLSCLQMESCVGKKEDAEPGILCCYDQEYPEKLCSRQSFSRHSEASSDRGSTTREESYDKQTSDEYENDDENDEEDTKE